MTCFTAICLALSAYGQPGRHSVTVVSGIATHHEVADPAADPRRLAFARVPAVGVTLYCASGRHVGSPGADEGVVFQCPTIWDQDVTSGVSGDRSTGLFHFFNPDPIDIGVSILHRLEDEAGKQRYYSTFRMVAQRGSARSVKLHLVLHPTNKPFQSVAMAADRTARGVAARVSLFRHRERLGLDETEQDVRAAIRSEFAIVVDSLLARPLENPPDPLLRGDPRQMMEALRERLGGYRVQVFENEEPTPLLAWLPENFDFWLERNGSWKLELDRWTPRN